MIALSTLLTRQSPPPSLSSPGGWLELPNGQHWKPSPGQVQFVPDSAPIVRLPRRRWWAKLMGVSS